MLLRLIMEDEAVVDGILAICLESGGLTADWRYSAQIEPAATPVKG